VYVFVFVYSHVVCAQVLRMRAVMGDAKKIRMAYEQVRVRVWCCAYSACTCLVCVLCNT
jgi:hypothetical protein